MQRIGVIGSGVSGLSAAWALRDVADVTVFEKSDRPGGHAHTVSIDYQGTPIDVDVGFICYNEQNYPNLCGLLDALSVETIETDMSFAVSDPAAFEWSSDPTGLFAWKRNAANPKFLSLLAEIIRFNRMGRQQVEDKCVPDMPLGIWLDQNRFSQLFRTSYLLPMSAAIWSTPENEMLDYPAESFLTFFNNHRLMHAARPKWRTVSGGSHNYVRKLATDLEGSILTRCGARTVKQAPSGETLVVDQRGKTHAFDAIIMASHADASLRVLGLEYYDQRLALGSVRFSKNVAYLHRDASLMPKRRAAWASWNVLKGADDRVCVTYWMNRLQSLPDDKPLFVTLNPAEPPAADKTFERFEFEHPIYDTPSAAARRTIQRIQGKDGLYFSGAWLGDGFHEAGLRTGLEAAFALGGQVPWTADIREHHTAPRVSIPETAHTMLAQ